MAARRTKRSDGRYTVTITHEGKRHFFYGTTQKEAREKAQQARDRIKVGSPVRDATRTLADWLQEWTDTTLKASTRANSTKALHAMFVRQWIVPTIGTVSLDRLKPSDVTRLLLAMQEEGKADSTRRKALDVLCLALDDAVTNGLLAANPARKVQRPTVKHKEARYLNPDEVAAFVKGTNGLRYADALRLILATGMRRGEALALRWADVTWERQEVRVNGALVRQNGSLIVTNTKTAGSRRTVRLSGAAMLLLKKVKAAQAAERLKAANVWEDSGLIFTTEFGKPVEPRNLHRAVLIAAKKAGLAGAHVHTLRHTYATTALMNGVPLKVVSMNLGHSSIVLTGDLYGHLTDEAAEAAAETVSDALGF